uniref:Receptor-type tyrosine-protein phosphatase C n=1 Tax=Neogobius melanostomus TaxID=47308 RepID=A0A8C6SR43_9GOBI
MRAQSCGEKQCCVKATTNDLCTDFTVTFNQSNCTFKYTKYLDAEKFLNLTNLTPTVLYFNNATNNGHPPKIVLPLPKQCKLTVNYTCGESNITLSEVKPFEVYNCTGTIKEGNKNITRTNPVRVNTSCDLVVSISPSSSTNTSISLEWDTNTENCNITQLRPNLTYKCSCPYIPDSSGKCDVKGLKAFTEYKCNVSTFYNDKRVSTKMENPKNLEKRTEAGVPDGVEPLTVKITENNVFTVACKELKDFKDFKGPEKKYKATLYLEDEQVDNKPAIDKCHFEFRDLHYLTTYKVQVRAFNGKHYSEPASETVHTLFNDKALIGFLVFLILITSLALLVVLYKIYILRRRKSQVFIYSCISFVTPSDEEERLLNVEPIPADALLDTYKKKLADEGRLFLAEFQSIPRIFSKFSMKEAKKNWNAIKNRYVDILPYDYNRVQLTTGNGEPGCDYINASFIDGYKEAKKYIAAQGPKEETITDFWRMVWEQKSSVIVMVTRCEEGSRVKCAEYWPSMERGAEIFEEFVVKVNSEDHCPDYTIRHLSLTNKREKNTEREVTHIQFLSWPDHGVPGDPHLLLKLRRRVNAFKNLFSGPIVVHCSAGVGRTGTYISIDAMMEGLEAEGRVDIYGYVVQLRRQRCLMVQVEAQYILIYQALLEHNQFGETEISLSELHSTLSTLKEQSTEEESTLMHEEFQRMPVYKNWRTYNAGITEENKQKNRSSTVIPYDYNRVLVRLDDDPSHDSEDDEEEEESSDEEEESSKYINASHIGGYWGTRCFITAQTPLTDTAADFWLMVHQKKVSHIIMLSDSKLDDSDSTYWSKEKTNFGDIEVEVTSTETTPVFISRMMSIRHVKRKESRALRHYQFLKWGDGEVPEKAQDLVDMLRDIRSKCGSGKALTASPALVHCSDGSSRCGLLVALWNLLDSAETEKLVDVFQVVKTLRKERAAMISSMEEYHFLYDTLQACFPVQNGEVKAPHVSAANTVEIVDETTSTDQTPTKTSEANGTEQESGTTGTDQQGRGTTRSQQRRAQTTPLHWTLVPHLIVSAP